MGFEIEEVPHYEEIPYSFKDYLIQPMKLSSKVFKGIVTHPKLKYWIFAILISSIFTTAGSWFVLNKLKLIVRISEELPQITPALVEGIIETLLKNPLIIFIDSLLSEIIASLITGLIIFALTKLWASRGSFSSGIMMAGLKALPSVVYGVLLALLGFSMPEFEWMIEIGPQTGISGFGMSIPWEIFAQEFLLQLAVSIWFLIVLIAGYKNGYGMTKGKAILSSLITWLVSNIFFIIGILPYI